jgi:phage terminase large subunit-like protein
MYPKCRTTLIEDKANGSAIIQILRKKIGGIIAVDPFGGKVSRVNAIAGAIESGNCHLPVDKPFTEDFVDECSAFPNGQHDDQVDAMSQCLNRLVYHNAKTPVVLAKNALEEAFPFLKKKTKRSGAGLGDSLNVI